MSHVRASQRGRVLRDSSLGVGEESTHLSLVLRHVGDCASACRRSLVWVCCESPGSGRFGIILREGALGGECVILSRFATSGSQLAA